MWTTFARDAEFLEYSFRSFHKFGKPGAWNDLFCLFPTRDRHILEPICSRHGIPTVQLDEWEGRGFNWHQAQVCRADTFASTDIVWHMDADCIVTAPFGPEDLMREGKVIAPFYRFGGFKRDAAFGPGMWKSRVDEAIGGDVRLSVMTGHPHGHYREVYAAARAAVELKHPEGFDNYVRRCENNFPQGFCEFETLGAIAQSDAFRDRYCWIDLEKEVHPATRFIAECWSHGGLDYVTEDRIGGKSPRQLFSELGL